MFLMINIIQINMIFSANDTKMEIADTNDNILAKDLDETLP